MNLNNSKMECGNGAKDTVSASLDNLISTEKRLADAHWKYVEQTIRSCGVSEDMLKIIGYQYVASFCHGFKHAKEEIEGRYKSYGGGSYPPSILTTLYK